MGRRSSPSSQSLPSPPADTIAEPSTTAQLEHAPSAGRGEGLGALLFSGLMSAGIGMMRSIWLALRGLTFGLGSLLMGRFTCGIQHLRLGLMKLVQCPLDVLLSLGGRALSALQEVLGREPLGCRPTAKQLAELRKVFGEGLDYERVRLKVGRLGLLALTARPFVLGNTLYIPRNIPSRTAGALQLPMHLLIRGMGNVWQYQNGGTDYICETLWARCFGTGTDWRTVLDEGRGWHELDPEQQVRFLQEAHARSKYFVAAGQRFIDEDTGRDYTRQLQAALAQLHTRQGAP